MPPLRQLHAHPQLGGHHAGVLDVAGQVGDEVGCGFRAKMGMELIHTTCPSAKPNPDVQLPPAPSLLAQLMNEAN